MTKRPISDKTKNRYARAAAFKVAKGYKGNTVVQSHLGKLKNQLRALERCIEPKRKKRLRDIATNTIDALIQIDKDKGKFILENHSELYRLAGRISGRMDE